MLLNMFHGKIHRATVTEACLEYMGSITIDSELLELSGIMPGERVQPPGNLCYCRGTRQRCDLP